jgi:hypothetical protein
MSLNPTFLEHVRGRLYRLRRRFAPCQKVTVLEHDADYGPGVDAHSNFVPLR